MKTLILHLITSLLIVFSAARLGADSIYATPYTFTTLAGNSTYAGYADGTGSSATFTSPVGTAVDASGNVFVLDGYYGLIRKVTPDGGVTTFVGYAYGSPFNSPNGLAIDGSGNLYVADTNYHMIRKVSPTGTITTLAGYYTSPGSADGTGGSAQFQTPYGIAVDGSGNVYVSDLGNYNIRKITPDGGVTTLAGQAGSYGSADGTGTDARFYEPEGIAVDNQGNVYVASSGNATIRKITPDGGVTTIAGSAGQFGSTDGTGSAALFNQPAAIAVDGSGNLFVGDTNNGTIRKITPDGGVTTLAGSPGVDGVTDGTGSAALFGSPRGICIDSSGTLYVADSEKSTIREGVPPTAALDLFSGVVKPSGYKKSPWFGVYIYNSYPLVYEFNLGYEYAYDAGGGGVYLYDYTSGHFWYTDATDFPVVYDFTLNAFLYYYIANTPHRHFYNFSTNRVITE